jgi:hypothetical protein
VTAGLRRHVGRAGPERLLHTLAQLLADPVALRAAALLVAQLDLDARERIVINEKEHNCVRT